MSEKSYYDNIPIDDDFEHHHSHNINNKASNNNNHRYTKARNYLMPPINNYSLRNLKNPHINVNRSVSFQGTCGEQSYSCLKPRPNVLIRRRNNENISSRYRFDTPSDIGSTRSSISPSGSKSSRIIPACDCNSITFKTDVQNDDDNCSYDSYDKKCEGPFYIKMLRRMQKISSFWRKGQSKKSQRGRFLDSMILSCCCLLTVDFFRRVTPNYCANINILFI